MPSDYNVMLSRRLKTLALFVLLFHLAFALTYSIDFVLTKLSQQPAKILLVIVQ